MQEIRVDRNLTESEREWANRGSSGCRVSMCSTWGGENERLYDALRKTESQELELLPKPSSSTTSCGCTDTEHFCGDVSGLKVRVPLLNVLHFKSFSIALRLAAGNQILS